MFVTLILLGGPAMEPGSPMHADVLVVIHCLDEQSHIKKVIASIMRDPLSKRISVIVADGGSVDGTRQTVACLAEQSPNLRLMINPSRIQSAGINRAARVFGRGCRWLVRMDAHAEYRDSFVSQLVAEAERTSAASVVVAMRARGASCFEKAAAAAQNSLLGTGGSPHRRGGAEGFVDHGHHALFEMQRFLALGGYDETQSYNEDAEFDVRLARSGGRIWLTRATEVVYFPRGRARDLFLQYRNHGRGRAQTILRHRLRPKIRQLLPAAVVPSVLAAFCSPEIPLAALPALFWLLACAAAGMVLGLRERSRCALASGCAAPIIHFAWSLGFWLAFLEAAAGVLPCPALTARLRAR